MYLELLLNLEEPVMDPLLWPAQPTHLLIGIENTASVAATALVVLCLWDISDTIMAAGLVVRWSLLSGLSTSDSSQGGVHSNCWFFTLAL